MTKGNHCALKKGAWDITGLYYRTEREFRQLYGSDSSSGWPRASTDDMVIGHGHRSINEYLVL